MAKENNELLYKKNNYFAKLSKDELNKVFAYCEDYKKFIDDAKIEREVITHTVEVAKKQGFVQCELDLDTQISDKMIFVNKDKSVAFVKIGKNGLDNGVRIIASHTDSPRLDLKPNPLYEASDIAYLKTHYYGGVKKYQWLATPLAMHGTVVLKDGSSVNVCVGEKEEDPIFYISDLLPHLSQEINAKTVDKAFPGENLNIICAGIPCDEVESEGVKYNVLKMLNTAYGIVEEDFLSAEIEFVPALKAKDVGFDRAFIAGYGHDDKVCAYPAFTAILASNDENTSIVYLVDKEEIGSEGVSGAQSKFILDVIEFLCAKFNKYSAKVRQNSQCISADVNSAFDPNYADCFEKNNSSPISYGVVINKYTGARGKSGASDASAEFFGHIRKIFNDNNLTWQAAEMGRIDLGGGGTVAKYFANLNIDTIDIGVPVISMHAPYELISKADLYSAYQAFLAFLNN